MTDPAAPTFRLHVLGTRELSGPEGNRVGSVLAQPKRLCLLLYLALAEHPVSRASLAALFWPESDEARARNALSQAVHYLRKSLVKGAVVSIEGDLLHVPPDVVWCDARELLAERPLPPEVVTRAHLDVLAGWNADDSQALQEWLDGVRRRTRALGEALQEGAAGTPEVSSTARREAAIDPSASPAPTQHPGRQRRTAVVATGVVGTVALVAALSSRFDLVDEPEVTIAQIVMIEPKSVTTDEPLPDYFADALRLEFGAAIAAVPGLSFSSSLAPSAQEARRQMEVVGEPVEGKWVLEVLAVVGQNTVRCQISLDGGGEGHPRTFEVEFATRGDLLMAVPSELADSVVRHAERVLLNAPRTRARGANQGGGR